VSPPEKRSRVITEPLGGSALSLAAQRRSLPADVQPWWPADVEEWRRHAESVRAGADRDWLPGIRDAMAPGGAAAQRLARVADGRGVVVTTGQQAGLFGGPVYTLSKALSAIALADALEKQLGIPVAPVFWAATDDADFVEAATTWVADADGLRELALRERPPAGTPMSSAPLGDIADLIESLRKACGSAAHPAYFEAVSETYGTRRTLGDAYVAHLRCLLEPLGMAVLDSSHRAYREAAAPLLHLALDRAADVAAAIATRTAAIRAAGFEPQVDDDRGLSLVFAIENGVKRRVPIASARVDGAKAELAPNVLLRPVTERALLPTVAYVAGPGELAYFAQSSAAAEALDRPRVVGVPRWSCTVIEPFTERALRRLGVEPRDMADVRALERRLASGALPAEVSQAWRELGEQVSAAVARLGDAVARAGLMPPEVIQGLDRSLGHRLSRAERRLLAAAKRRDERIRNDVAVAAAALYPLGKRQERALNFVPMLTRGGDDLMHEMRAAAGAHAELLLGGGRHQPVPAR